MRIKRRPPFPDEIALLAEMAAARDERPDLQLALRLANGAFKDATLARYEKTVDQFVRWAQEVEADPFGGEVVVARFLELIARDRTASTVRTYKNAIGKAYLDRGLADPTRGSLVSRLVEGTHPPSRTRGNVHPISATEYLALCAAQPATRMGLRNRVLFGAGFEAALAAQEMLGLEVGDVSISEAGVQLAVRMSRSPRAVSVARRGPGDFVEAVAAWLAETGLTSGPLLRGLDRNGGLGSVPLSVTAVCGILKKEMAAILEVPPPGVSTRSLRIGHLMESMRHRISTTTLTKHLGFTRTSSLTRYVRRAEADALTRRLTTEN